MPNNTLTNLTIHGPINEITRFMLAVQSLGNPFDFNGVVPMPKEVANISHPVSILTQEQLDAGILPDPDGFITSITQATSDDLIAKFGFNNWYDWANDNWGTKWGAYDATEWNVMENGDDSSAVISYQTAWSPATEFFVQASVKYPLLKFQHKFADEGGGFLGTETFQNGEIIGETDLVWDSREGQGLRQELGCYCEDED